jgi:hypothetical protein
MRSDGISKRREKGVPGNSTTNGHFLLAPTPGLAGAHHNPWDPCAYFHGGASMEEVLIPAGWDFQPSKQRDCPNTSFDGVLQLFAGGLTQRARGAA